MDIKVIVNQILLLSLVIVIGYISFKVKVITENAVINLTDILLKIAMPALIISSFQSEFSKEIINDLLLVLLLSSAAFIFSIIISHFIYKKYDLNMQAVMKFATVFPNSGFMGFPVLLSIYGSVGVMYGSITSIPFNIIFWTYGIIVFSGKSDENNFKNALMSPGLISVIVGILLLVFQIKLPFFIVSTLSTVGGITSPLAMLIVGAILAEHSLKGMFSDFKVYGISIIRLLIVSIFVIFFAKVIGLSGLPVEICAILYAMPAPAFVVVFAKKYNRDSILASRLVLVSTLFSLITIPFIIFLLQNIL